MCRLDQTVSRTERKTYYGGSATERWKRTRADSSGVNKDRRCRRWPACASSTDPSSSISDGSPYVDTSSLDRYHPNGDIFVRSRGSGKTSARAVNGGRPSERWDTLRRSAALKLDNPGSREPAGRHSRDKKPRRHRGSSTSKGAVATKPPRRHGTRFDNGKCRFRKG